MSGKYFIGFVLILLGVGIFLNQAGVLDFGYAVATYWPLIIIAAGAFQLFKRSLSLLTGAIIIGIGLILQLNNLDYLPEDYLKYVWPTIIILIGLSILTSKFKFGAPMATAQENLLNHFVAFSGLKTNIESSSFKGGSVMAIFGGAEIDLRGSNLAEGAVLDLTAAFGGIEIRVPQHWKVVVSGLPLFGGWENKVRGQGKAGANQPVLKINCLALFGGIEIKD